MQSARMTPSDAETGTVRHRQAGLFFLPPSGIISRWPDRMPARQKGVLLPAALTGKPLHTAADKARPALYRQTVSA